MMLLQRIRNVLLLALAAAIVVRVVAWLLAPAIPLLIVLSALVVIPSLMFRPPRGYY
jgi:hypothetical protein